MTIYTDTYEGLRQYLQATLEMRKRYYKHHKHHKHHKELAYFGMEDFLLQHGREYHYAPLPNGITPGRLKACFCNAYKLARKKKWHYVEGMATSVIPTLHAWVVNPAEPNQVIDPTWDGIKDELSGITRVYIGVPFNLKLIGDALKREGSMLDDWKGDFPLYTGQIKRWEP